MIISVTGNRHQPLLIWLIFRPSEPYSITGIFTHIRFRKFFLRFVISFCFLYYGTLGIIGLSTPGNYYVPFIANRLDYVSGLRNLLMECSRLTMQMSGFSIQFLGNANIRFASGRGVHIGYDCIGYGVLAFWIAFILANQSLLKRKIKWLTVGAVVIFIINVLRINLMLLAVNRNWADTMQIDHHFWFNVVAYSAIFFMIYRYDKQDRMSAAKSKNQAHAG